ncbi:hypothetical protein SUGI_0054680 [Cryptomeria japonica]|nr:hypothetical protein SUGI_0054680 [Cryptomeria japonica]
MNSGGHFLPSSQPRGYLIPNYTGLLWKRSIEFWSAVYDFQNWDIIPLISYSAVMVVDIGERVSVLLHYLD